MHTFAIVGLVLSILALFTTKPVSNLLAPGKEGFMAIPRTLMSVGWLVFGPFVAVISALVFALLLALSS